MLTKSWNNTVVKQILHPSGGLQTTYFVKSNNSSLLINPGVLPSTIFKQLNTDNQTHPRFVFLGNGNNYLHLNKYGNFAMKKAEDKQVFKMGDLKIQFRKTPSFNPNAYSLILCEDEEISDDEGAVTKPNSGNLPDLFNCIFPGESIDNSLLLNPKDLGQDMNKFENVDTVKTNLLKD